MSYVWIFENLWLWPFLSYKQTLQVILVCPSSGAIFLHIATIDPDAIGCTNASGFQSVSCNQYSTHSCLVGQLALQNTCSDLTEKSPWVSRPSHLEKVRTVSVFLYQMVCGVLAFLRGKEVFCLCLCLNLCLSIYWLYLRDTFIQTLISKCYCLNG